MEMEYLLDTNAYFNFLNELSNLIPSERKNEILGLNTRRFYISEITSIEIISALGKYARGNSGGSQKCNCIIDPNGTICNNQRFTVKRNPWQKRRIKAWLKMIEETQSGKSNLFNVELISLDRETLEIANKIILYSLSHNFGSMDAVIAATAKKKILSGEQVTVVTSDKALKACLSKCDIPIFDIYK